MAQNKKHPDEHPGKHPDKRQGRKRLFIRNKQPLFETSPKLPLKIPNTEPNKYADEMYAAITAEDIATLKTYLDLGGDPNSIKDFKNGNMFPLIFEALTKKNLLYVLLAYGANPNAESTGWLNYAIIRAAEQREIESCKLLVKYGANVNVRASDGSTALMHAAEKGSMRGPTRFCEFLIEHNAEIDAQDNKGKTALMYAVQYAWENDERRFEICECLLKIGANPLLKNIEGKTAYDLARGREAQIIAELIKKYELVWTVFAGAGKKGGEFLDAIRNCSPDTIREMIGSL